MTRHFFVKTRNTGLVSMLVAIVIGLLASYMHEAVPNSVSVSICVGVALGAFLLWALCGLLLWVKALQWLFSTWMSRGNLSNLGLVILVISGGIIVPFFMLHQLTSQSVSLSPGSNS